jgi:hypothetical protein
MLEGLSYRFLLLIAAAILVPLAFFAGWQWLGVGYPRHSTPWSLLDVSDDGRTLTIGFVGSSCDSLDRIERSESATTVRLTAVLRRGPLADGCDDGDGYVEEVGLERGLAGRRLVDGHDGARPEILSRAVRWSLQGLAESGRAMTISYLGSSCDELNHVERRELEDAVEVKVDVSPSLVGGCTAAVQRERVVVFGSPLGERVLLDPRTAEPPPGFSETASGR